MFGDIFQWVRDAENKVGETELVYDNDPTLEHRSSLHHTQVTLNQYLSNEERFWKQKVGSRWICEGDHNTRYFHTMVQGRWITLHVRSIRI